ncbi:MAG: hypothetical protein JO125_16955 [Chloroflexi bacterium]|nr:hypothetical protein [Chloroflexota bacterium]
MGYHRPFFQRFGHQGICVLPTDVLCDDPLSDPETGEALPSLREQVGLVDGIHHQLVCYARVLKVCGDGLYWAEVASTPELADPHRVVLSEEDLYFALPYDVRVQGTSPAHLLMMMHAHRHAVRPTPRVEPTPERTPIVPLEPLATVEVSTDALQEALGLRKQDRHKDTKQCTVRRPISVVRMQQAFLHVMLEALLAQEQTRTTMMHSAEIACVQRWHQERRQRCVNAVPLCREGRVVWQLTVGIAA